MFETVRKQMVEKQIKARGLTEPRLMAALEKVPRHCFVLDEDRSAAYGDNPIPIGYGQTISQPYIVALMTSLLKLTGEERVLDVGTGSGYQAAILSQLAKEVHTVEVVMQLAERASGLLKDYSNVHCHAGDGSLGWPEAAPFDGIIVGAAAPRVPQPLLDQLKDGGRLVIPIGEPSFQMLEVWQRAGDDFQRTKEISVAFVPLKGQHGW